MSVRETVVLTVAGSDPSGGAGVQADLKTATALGVYGASVLTGLTAQNTRRVQEVHPLPAAFVSAQLASVVGDLDVRAVKTGMLGDAAVVAAVAAGLPPSSPLVVDPVVVATSGDRLVPQDAVAAIRALLVPRAAVVTPNAPEARLLTGAADLVEAGRRLVGLGARHALVKGGHVEGGTVTDLLVSAEGVVELSAPRVDTPHTHGTGCTLSAAIAARLALGDDVSTAVDAAREYLRGALLSGAGRQVGAGHGPVDHLWRLR
ncbi:bifunctional hydroxymethylpyrimidine kinase/phosphomethylpyrimidine kinase [Nocardioides nanhaiensis]|uniref:Bifunctional hydroxymethylpyrimidine kinase/phosphomethylpyrimidine kinase n=1 Tax=Nocardioides nanhaiensis TaxID=1476871 RepID=A0ABP8VXI7_9ACTN